MKQNNVLALHFNGESFSSFASFIDFFFEWLNFKKTAVQYLFDPREKQQQHKKNISIVLSKFLCNAHT